MSGPAWAAPAERGLRHASRSIARWRPCRACITRRYRVFDGRDSVDFVFLYAPPWFGPTRFSKHHLASYLAARGGRVLYVEAPLNPFGLRRGRAFVAELH